VAGVTRPGIAGGLGRALRALVAVATLAVALGIGLGFLGAQGEIFDAIGNFRLHLSGLALGLLAIAAVLRHRSAALVAALAAGAGLAGLGPVWQPALRPGGTEPVTVLFANLSDRNTRPAAMRAALHAAEADILVTAETRRRLVEGATALTETYPHRLMADSGVTHRVAIWSRYPLSRRKLHLNDNVGPTGASAAVTLPSGRRFGLIGVHLARPVVRFQHRQARAMGAIADRLPEPLVILGDFNAAPWSQAVRLAAQTTGTRPVGGHRVTWRGAYPLGGVAIPEPYGQQIDHALLGPGIGVAGVETRAIPGSDHRGLLVRLRMPP